MIFIDCETNVLAFTKRRCAKRFMCIRGILRSEGIYVHPTR
jgi:hypothetical protein